jgi:hypothetical protein
MAFTVVPSVIDGDDLIDDFTLAVKAFADEVAGTVSLASTTWAPTVAGLTKGNGSETAKYFRVGPLVCCFYRFFFGSTSAITGDVSVTNPFTSVVQIAGSGYILDSGTTSYDASVTGSAASVAVRPILTSGTYATGLTVFSATVPMTWTTNDEFVLNWAFLVA